jgi:O-acetylhomoserine (thiol)-lyase
VAVLSIKPIHIVNNSHHSYAGIMNERPRGFRTRALHAGGRPDPTTGARGVPIGQTTIFVLDDSSDAADVFALQKYGNIHSRIGNPAVAAFEERMASLEGGTGAVATSGGQAAELLTFTALAAAGDHLVASGALRGGTRALLPPAGQPEAFAAAIRSTTNAFSHAGAVRGFVFGVAAGNLSQVV